MFEAMATGMPVVVWAGTGAHEVLTDGVNGLVVPERDPLAILNAILRLVEDDTLRMSLSREGRRLVESSLSWKQLGTVMEGLFQQVV